jgi:hypothetical protein
MWWLSRDRPARYWLVMSELPSSAARPLGTLALLALACAALAAAPVRADTGKLVAVLEIGTRLPPGVTVDRGYLSDRVRGAVLRALPGARLMTRDNIEVIAKAAGVDLASCDGECVVETGRKLGADLLVSGELVRLGEQLRLSLRLHDVKEGRLLSLAQAGGKSPEELDRDLDRALPELVEPLRSGAAVASDDDINWMALWRKDSLSVVAGGAFLGPSSGLEAELLVHVFGLEYRVAEQPQHARQEVGIAPVTLSTQLAGRFELAWLQPYAAFNWTSGTATSDQGLRGGVRSALWFFPHKQVSLRAGLDFSFLKTRLAETPSGVRLSFFAGAGLTL